MPIRQCDECEWVKSMNANQEMLAGNAEADARYFYDDSDATLILTLIP